MGFFGAGFGGLGFFRAVLAIAFRRKVPKMLKK
ncbi:hypothetical protein NIES4074_28790 [Cylindrospermum sp. NIES-4074]|nr:hypothetical protein NIES4074_28790 [Cylindrospermum sp. NIES-4074]